MGMSDNPLVGDYTKGISKGPDYFRALQRRCQAEKYPVARLKPDWENPLFAMLRGAVTPLQIVKGHDPACLKKQQKQPVDKFLPVQVSRSKKPRQRWKSVPLTSLRAAWAE